MAHVEEQAIVGAPIETVFDLIADSRRALTWLEGFTRFELVPGPERGLGATVRSEGRFLGFSVDALLEIVDYQPPRRLVSRSTGRVQSQTTWALDPVTDGTRVTFTGDYDLPLALRLFGDRVLEQHVGGQVRQSLANLKRLFEQDATNNVRC
jgi:carbon monoxide dehydrogenase subunit G